MAEQISKRKLNRILELNEKLVLENDFSKRISLVSQTTKDILNVDRCTIFIHDENSKSMWSIYIDGISYMEVPEDIGISGKVYRTKKTIMKNNIQKDELHNSSIDYESGYTTKSILAMPIMGYDGKVLGVMEFINKIDKNGIFGEEDVKIVNYVIGHISAYLEIMMQEK